MATPTGMRGSTDARSDGRSERMGNTSGHTRTTCPRLIGTQRPCMAWHVTQRRSTDAAFDKAVAKARKELRGARPRSDRAKAAAAVEALVECRGTFAAKLSAAIEKNAKQDREAGQAAARAIADTEQLAKQAAAAHARLAKRSEEEGVAPPPPLTDWVEITRKLAEGVQRIEPRFLAVGDSIAHAAVESVYDHRAVERAKFLFATSVEAVAIAGGLMLPPLGAASLAALLLSRKVASDASCSRRSIYAQARTRFSWRGHVCAGPRKLSDRNPHHERVSVTRRRGRDLNPRSA